MARLIDLPKGISIRRGKFYVDITVRGERHTGTFCDLETAELQCAEWRAGKADNKGQGQNPTPQEPRVWSLGKAFEVAKLRRWVGTKAEKTTRINARSAHRWFPLVIRFSPAPIITGIYGYGIGRPTILVWMKTPTGFPTSYGTRAVLA